MDRRHGRIDLTALSAYLGQSMVRDDDALAFGESVATRHDALFSLQAPDFTLLDIDGKLHSLSDFCGKKVLMYSWGFLLRLLV